MGAHKLGDGRKPGKKEKAPCCTDLRGGGFVMLPKVLIESAAWRGLSLHARAALIEIHSKNDGYRNGALTISNRQLMEALGCSPNRAVAATKELMEHGFIDVAVEGTLRDRQARQYRLTYVHTKTAPATNDYAGWTPAKAKSGAIAVIAKGGSTGTTAIAERRTPDTTAIARMAAARRRDPSQPAIAVVTPISIPYPPVPPREHKGDCGPLSTDGPKSGSDEQRACEQCGGGFELARKDRAYPRRFCSDRCQRANAAKRAYHRKAHGDDAQAIGAVLAGSNVHRLIAGAWA